MEDDDERWMLLDTDHYTSGTHIKSFIAAITKAKQQGIRVALSKPCFELWLLLHHVNEEALVTVSSAADVVVSLREKLGQYNKSNLKSEHFPLTAVAEACQRAQRLDETVAGGDIPEGNTTRVYLLWKAITDKALPSQLPTVLRDFATPVSMADPSSSAQ